MASRQAIVLDTDVGTDVDDALAIGLILASPELDLRAVTTVSGDVTRRAQIAKKLLVMGGQPDVPVLAGVRHPVLRQRSFLWLGHEGKGIIHQDDAIAVVREHAVDALIDLALREHPRVVAIGPLSNLAVAIMKEPAVIDAIPHLTVMGGSLRLSSDPGVPAIEYNLGSDAEASLVVLSAGIPTTLVPLDVTWRTFFRSRELARLRESGSRLVQALCDAMEVWWPVHREFFAGTRSYDADIVAFLHDPLTVAVLLDRSLVALERMRLRPEIVDGSFRFTAEASAPEIEVAVEVDAPRVVEFLLQRLARLS
jgi:purine nucleosidase